MYVPELLNLNIPTRSKLAYFILALSLDERVNLMWETQFRAVSFNGFEQVYEFAEWIMLQGQSVHMMWRIHEVVYG
jgi:hypothetical protein